MFKEPHPADIKSVCSRCGKKYYLSEECSCSELSENEIEEALVIAAEEEIDRRERFAAFMSNYYADIEQTKWEASKTRDRY